MGTKKIALVTISDLLQEPNIHRKAVTLKEAGYNVSLLALENPALERSLWQGIDLKTVSIKARSLPQKLWQFWRKMLPLVRRTSADLFIAYDVYPLPLLRLNYRKTGVPYVYDSVELFTEIEALRGKPLRRWFWKKYEWRGVEEAAAAYTVCASDAAVLRSKYPFLPRVSVVRNIPQAHPVGKPVDLRKRYKIASSSVIGIYQGRLFKGRGLEALINALPRVPAFTLVLMGDGPLKEPLTRKAHQLGVTERVIFAGSVPFQELPAYTAGADVGITLIDGKGLSYYHALPNKLFEYIQQGLPVLASDYPEIQKIVKGEDIGICVNPFKQEEIVKALKELCRSDIRARYSAQAQQIGPQYTWQKEKERFLSVIAYALDLKK